MTVKKSKSLNDTEIKLAGIEALNKALGPAGALRFLTLLQREPTDYVQISHQFYQDQTIDEIFKRSKEEWASQ